ncbi:MAG TPA: FtsX-like permease family protein, partial [Phototrophicaceae bacterium]|nr:FtsX-like permease family protein [Phototrophicaceae bacterium]
MNLAFYLQYAARNLWRNRRWSTFAVFSVAAGVATVVALRSLGLAIGDALTSNIRSSNYGDITIQMGGESAGPFNFSNPEDEQGFSDTQIQSVQNWVDEHDAKMTVYTIAGNMQVSSQDYVGAGRPQFISSLFVDPQTFPPTADIYASDPAGVRLSDLFQGGNEVVISQNLADAQNIKAGDKVRVSGTTEEFIVRGIVPTAVRTGFRDLMAAFFGFAIFPNSTKDLLPVQETPTTISVMLADGATTQDIETAEEALRSRVSDYVSFRTVPRMLKENQQIADVLGSFIVVMGLGALLIGGVGIINTMLVMVGRRTEEIAALKTFGLKAEQIAALFMSEAFLLGLAGSVLGGFFGALLSTVANVYGQALIQQSLTWRLYPEAIFFGLVLGLIITVVFGVLPVLTAVKVRPAIILRPNETQIPRAGVFQSLLSLVLVVVSVGLMAGQMLLPAFKVATGSPRAAASIW